MPRTAVLLLALWVCACGGDSNGIDLHQFEKEHHNEVEREELFHEENKTRMEPVFEHYKENLESAYMPLCGNGRLDSAADYATYFASPAHYAGTKLSIQRARLVSKVPGVNDMIEVKMGMNELCDDGNRLDGDGCSADCMTLDSYVSACQIPLNVDNIEDFMFLDATLILSLGDGIYKQTASKLEKLASKSAACKGLISHASIIYVYLADDGVYRLGAGLLPGTLTQLFVAPALTSFFWKTLNGLYFVCQDPTTTKLALWNVLTQQILNSSTYPNERIDRYLPSLPGLLTIAPENSDMITVSPITGFSDKKVVQSSPEPRFWVSALTVALLTFLQTYSQEVEPFDIAYVPPITLVTDDRFVLNTYPGRVVGVYQLGIIQTMESPRWLLDPAKTYRDTSQLYLGILQDRPMTISVCNEDLALDPTSYAAYRILRDTPLNYDVLSKTSYSPTRPLRGDSANRTYLDELADVMLTVTSKACGDSASWGAALKVCYTFFFLKHNIA